MKRLPLIYSGAFVLFAGMFFAGSGISSAWAQDEIEAVPFESTIDLSDQSNTEGEGTEPVRVARSMPNFPVKTISGEPMVEDMVRRIINSDLDVHPRQIGTLFFSNTQKDLIMKARLGLMTRPPKEGETPDPSQSDPITGEQIIDGPRELIVGGIVYNSASEWTVWLNGQKITPKSLPPQVYDIEVYKNYIKLKWHDARTNKIYPVKLKSNQRFNIDTRIFLPG